LRISWNDGDAGEVQLRPSFLVAVTCGMLGPLAQPCVLSLQASDSTNKETACPALALSIAQPRVWFYLSSVYKPPVLFLFQISLFYIRGLLFFCSVLELEPGAYLMLGKCSNTELHPSPLLLDIGHPCCCCCSQRQVFLLMASLLPTSCLPI
jgi:hypothetical protein